MDNFDVTERETENGAIIEIRTRHGLLFDNGGTSIELVARTSQEPRIGETVRCGNLLIRVSDKRYDSNGKLWLMDEDTLAWFDWKR